LQYLDYITGRHSLYERYADLWRLCENSWYGGAEYKHGHYLRAYAVDTNTPSEAINTYVTDSDGSVVSKYQAKIENGYSKSATEKGNDPLLDGSFYGEKLEHTPLYNYVKLIVAEYNAILFRNPPQRELPADPDVDKFVYNVDGEGNNDISEFMALVDMYSTIYGVCHVGCYKPTGSDIPKFKIHNPLEVTNWSYRYDASGDLQMDSIVINVEDSDYHRVYRHITPEVVETYFVGDENSDDYEPPKVEGVEHLGDNTYVVRQENELGYIPIVTVYQSTKIYNNIGTSIIHDVAQIQRSIYGDMAEIYSAITYSSSPTLVVDENTEQLNGGQIGAEPGAIVRVQSSLTGESTYTYEFVSPKLDAISEIRELIDSKIQKLTQIAMLRSEDLIKSSRSGEQIEVYDDKLASLIRRKATNLENAEYKMWNMWYDWLNQTIPADFRISYSRQFNKRALDHEIGELQNLMRLYDDYAERFIVKGTEEYASAQEAEARAEELGGSGSHSHSREDGTVVYMPFATHSEYEQAVNTEPFAQELKQKLQERMMELLNSTSTSNGL